MVSSTSSPPPALTYSLHQGQLEFIGSPARTTVVTAGQGGGKTTGYYWWFYGSMQLFPNESWLLGFPDYGLLNRVILNQPDPDRPTLVQFLDMMGEAPRLHIQDRWIECKSGRIFFASGKDLVGWEGAHVKGAVLDEFDECPLAAYRRAMERTRMRQGRVLLVGTPRNVAWVKTELQPKWEAGTTSTPAPSVRVQISPDGDIKRVQFESILNPTYSASAMAEAERTLPSWEFRRLYKGELAGQEGGNLFHREWWNRYQEPPPPPYLELIQVWDTAFKDKTKNDYSAGPTWARTRSGIYLLDMVRSKLEYPALLSTAKSYYQKWKPNRILVEDKASGQSLIQDLRALQLPVIAVPVPRNTDKYARASAVTGLVEAGHCYLPDWSSWVHDFIEEHADFPESDHDDQVDTTSIALAYFKSTWGSGGNSKINTGTKSSAWGSRPK